LSEDLQHIVDESSSPAKSGRRLFRRDIRKVIQKNLSFDDEDANDETEVMG
jgi:hypothetical protein